MYKVYAVQPDVCYGGMALVAAENADEANSFIKRKKENDVNNSYDSWGYTSVVECDAISDVYSKEKGIVYCGIRYVD